MKESDGANRFRNGRPRTSSFDPVNDILFSFCTDVKNFDVERNCRSVSFVDDGLCHSPISVIFLASL